MKDFVFGTAADFAALDRTLNDHQCHIFNRCQLPEGCSKQTARLGFEKNPAGHYIFYIDKGIETQSSLEPFRQLLAAGYVKFVCLEDMVDFLHSLAPLFPAHRSGQNPAGNTPSASGLQPPEVQETDAVLPPDPPAPAPEEPAGPVYDPERVEALRQQESKPKMVWPEEIAAPLKKKIYGQDEVIDEIARKIVINKMAKKPRLLVITMIGPTATGKSETAKSLAEVLGDVYETPYGYVEIAGSEFIGEHTINRFFGAPPGYVGFGEKTVLEPIRNNPRHVIVINEIEKAHVKLLEGLMEAIDTGMLGMADNSGSINLNQCILCFTSNLPVDRTRFDSMNRYEREEMCRDEFTRFCGRPEISGKIANFVVFNPLSDPARMEIVVKFIRQELSSYSMKLARIDEELMLDFMKVETKYGARGIRNVVSDSLGEYLLTSRKIDELKDKTVCLSGTISDIHFEEA